MLVRPWQPGGTRPAETSPESEFIGLADVAAFLRRYALSIAACTMAGATAALFSLLTTDPTYTAASQILIEPKLPQYLQQTGAVSTSLDTAQIESQIAVMRSEKITQMVIDQLRLMDNPDFFILRQASFGERLERFGGGVLRLLGLSAPGGAVPRAAPAPAPDLSDFERGRIAIDLFGQDIDIRRVGVSYAVAISFRSRNPQLAAEVANATAESFVREQIETKAAQARQGGEWLEQRMSEMRGKMNTATQIAQEFRSRHDYSVKPPGARLVNGQIVREDEAAASQPTLEELEVTADTYRQLYESFLRAFTDNLSQQSYPVADARVITAATRPLAPSHPRKKLVLAFGLVAGLVVGAGQALLRTAVDRTIRSPRQIEERLGLRCLAALPAFGAWGQGTALPDEVAASPRSAFSESLRRAKFALRREGATGAVRSIGVASALPGESKSMIASNLAALYAMSGLRTLLVDADADYALLTRKLVAGPGPAGETGIVPDAVRGVDLLPSTCVATLALGLPRFDDYDMVVVDLPPLAAGFEKLAVSADLDVALLVVDWGSSTVEAAEELALALRAHDAPVVGAILDKVRFLSVRPHRRPMRPGG